MTKQLCALVGVAFSALSCSADASAQTDKDFAYWIQVAVAGQILADKPSPLLWLDVHWRDDDVATTHILRPGIGVAVTTWLSAWVGYAWIPEWPDLTSDRIDEHRVWEQFAFDHKTDFGLWFQARTRFEQRFSEAGSGTAHRFRQLARLNFRPKGTSQVGIAFWDEVFLGMKGADWATQGFDQNRVFAGLAIFGGRQFRAEIGYLNAFLSRATDRLLHIFSVNFFVSFKGKKRRGGTTP